jgi:hypothetical protein
MNLRQKKKQSHIKKRLLQHIYMNVTVGILFIISTISIRSMWIWSEMFLLVHVSLLGMIIIMS